MVMRRWAPFAAVAAVLLMGVLAVPALGASGVLPAGSQGTVYACVSSNHTFTHVSVASPLACPSQQPVSWPVTAGGVPSPSPDPSPTSASPSPSPTTASPSPSPSATGAACVTSAASGGCGPYTGPGVYLGSNGADLVVQDVWNQIPGWSQTLTAYGPGNWNVAANMPAGNTAVVSYPDTQVTYTTVADQPDPLSDFSAGLSSSWSVTDPPGTGLDYEWAYDVWLGDTARQSWANDQEIMVWADNHGQRPAGTDTGRAYIAPDGTSYEIWTAGGSTSVSGTYSIVTFARDSNAVAGSVDLAAIISYLQANGYTSGSAGVDQVGFGAEICSTGGQPQMFAVTGYTLSDN